MVIFTRSNKRLNFSISTSDTTLRSSPVSTIRIKGYLKASSPEASSNFVRPSVSFSFKDLELSLLKLPCITFNDHLLILESLHAPHDSEAWTDYTWQLQKSQPHYLLKALQDSRVHHQPLKLYHVCLFVC